MIPKLVFLLCALTSLLCGILLLRSYLARRVRLLLWSGLCFIFFALSNALLILDRFVFTAYDLSLYISAITLTGLALLLYGLIWEA